MGEGVRERENGEKILVILCVFLRLIRKETVVRVKKNKIAASTSNHISCMSKHILPFNVYACYHIHLLRLVITNQSQ